MIGAPPVYGGYEYTPRSINDRKQDTLFEKQREAYLLLPLLFSDKSYNIAVSDPVFDNHQASNTSIFKDYPDIKVDNLIGKYTSYWMRDHPDIKSIDVPLILKQRLIRFSFFKMSPIFLRPFIYDNGNWFTVNEDKGDITLEVLNDYAMLDLLPALSKVEDGGDNFISIYGHLTHDAAYLQAPSYAPVQNVTDRGGGDLRNDRYFHTSMANFILLDKYLKFLKENDVYDNTRIILVSDHGRGNADWEGNITLPNGGLLQSFNSLLLVKDFNDGKKEGPETRLAINGDFMTNADAALFALSGIFENPQNPFTGKALIATKEDGADITTIDALSSYRHSENNYTIPADAWLHVRDNVFEKSNWSANTPQRE
jgi:hypothetical protein